MITIGQSRHILQLSNTSDDKSTSHVTLGDSFRILSIRIQALSPQILSKIPISIHQ